MQLRDPIVWATITDENPLPAGCPVDAARWATWLTTASSRERRELMRAMIPIIAEHWANAMEVAMHARRRGVGDVAAFALCDVLAPLAPLGVTPFQLGCIVAMLAACWHFAPLRDAEPILLRAVSAVSHADSGFVRFVALDASRQ